MDPSVAQPGALPHVVRPGDAGELPVAIAAGIAALGLLFGSFLNVCIARLPRHQSIVWPGSQCPACGSPIAPGDNIPLLSWVRLRGRCRSCRQPITWRYPAIELATALLFLLAAWRFGLGIEAAGAALVCFLLLGLLAMDAETMLLPDAFTLPGIALGLVHAAVVADPPLLHRLSDAGGALLAALSGATLMLAIRWGYWLVRRRHGMGLGDVKLVAMIAAWLGVLPTLLVLFLAVTAAAITGLVTAAIRKKGDQGETASLRKSWRTMLLPLGSFLCGAAILVLFVGPSILDWYLSWFP